MGLLEFVSEDDVENAIAKLNGTEFEGNIITLVKVALLS